MHWFNFLKLMKAQPWFNRSTDVTILQGRSLHVFESFSYTKNFICVESKSNSWLLSSIVLSLHLRATAWIKFFLHKSTLQNQNMMSVLVNLDCSLLNQTYSYSNHSSNILGFSFGWLSNWRHSLKIWHQNSPKCPRCGLTIAKDTDSLFLVKV